IAQDGGKLADSLEAVRRTYGKRLIDGTVDRLADQHIDLARMDKPGIQGHALDRRWWHAGGQQLIHRRAERIDVGPWARLAGRGVLLRGGVAFPPGLTHKRRGLIGSWELLLRDAQVYQYRVIAGCDDDVGRFDIAVQDRRNARVKILQCIANGQNPRDYLLLGERYPASAYQFLLEVLAVDEVHDQVETVLP